MILFFSCERHQGIKMQTNQPSLLLLFDRVLLMIGLLLISSAGFAMNLVMLEGEEEPQKNKQVIPYAFYNDTTDFALSAAVVATGYIQPQLAVVANGFASSNDTTNGFALVKDLQLHDRWFFDGKFMVGDFGLIESYQDGNPDFPNERAGSNDSDQDNFIETEGTDVYHRFNFRYVLPIGDGANGPIHKYVVDKRGLLVPGYESGGREWNPFNSGRLIAETEFFYRKQNLESQGDKFDSETSGVTLALEYDNTDFYSNPSDGSRLRLAFSRDWGYLDDSAPWSAVEFEATKLFNLGRTQDALQRVLAVNMWWIDSPTWDSSSKINGQETFHRPPLFAGATLGGLDRLKGYATNRFSDRSAVFYAAEYRHMPAYNPFPSIPLINKLRIPWWQWVVFAEAGRVHDEWDLSELHDDMKWDAGAGIRMNVEGVVVRLDAAVGEEDSQVQMFIGHTF
jgi:hypothetical protein